MCLNKVQLTRWLSIASLSHELLHVEISVTAGYKTLIASHHVEDEKLCALKDAAFTMPLQILPIHSGMLSIKSVNTCVMVKPFLAA